MLWQEMTNNFSLQQQNSNSHNICLKTFYGRYNSPFLFNNFCDFNLFKFSFPVLFIVDFFFFKIFHCLDILKMSQPVTFYEITSIWKTTHPDYFFQEFFQEANYITGVSGSGGHPEGREHHSENLNKSNQRQLKSQ